AGRPASRPEPRRAEMAAPRRADANPAQAIPSDPGEKHALRRLRQSQIVTSTANNPSNRNLSASPPLMPGFGSSKRDVYSDAPVAQLDRVLPSEGNAKSRVLVV